MRMCISLLSVARISFFRFALLRDKPPSQMGNLRAYRSLLQDSAMKIPDDRSIPDLVVSTSLCVVTSWTSSDVTKKFRNLVQSGETGVDTLPTLALRAEGIRVLNATCLTGRQSGLRKIILSLGEPTSLEVCDCLQ